jgi:hypothetical protein
LFVNASGTPYGLFVNSGMLDLNGNNQVVAALSSSNATPGSGGLITNLATGSPVTLTSNGGGTFAGSIAGNLNFTRSNTSSVFVADNTYTGVTTLRGGVLTLQQAGKLSGTSAINSYFGTLTLDNSASAISDIPQRIGATVPLSLLGGAFNYTGFPSAASAMAIGALSLPGGGFSINANACV